MRADCACMRAQKPHGHSLSLPKAPGAADHDASHSPKTIGGCSLCTSENSSAGRQHSLSCRTHVDPSSKSTLSSYLYGTRCCTYASHTKRASSGRHTHSHAHSCCRSSTAARTVPNIVLFRFTFSFFCPANYYAPFPCLHTSINGMQKKKTAGQTMRCWVPAAMAVSCLLSGADAWAMVPGALASPAASFVASPTPLEARRKDAVAPPCPRRPLRVPPLRMRAPDDQDPEGLAIDDTEWKTWTARFSGQFVTKSGTATLTSRRAAATEGASAGDDIVVLQLDAGRSLSAADLDAIAAATEGAQSDVVANLRGVCMFRGRATRVRDPPRLPHALCHGWLCRMDGWWWGGMG